jgi:predicted transcriptional regulator
MPSTTIKLPDELKARIASLIKGSGKTMHAFLLESIEERTSDAEKRAEFVATAVARRKKTLRTGLGLDAGEVHAYFRAKASGETPKRPKARSWRK